MAFFMRIKFVFLLLTIFSGWQLAAGSELKAVRFGRLIDGKGKVWTNAVVIVRGNKIDKVGGAEMAIPEGAEIIDLTRYTGIPG